MKTYEIPKPKGTFYSDYVIKETKSTITDKPNKCYAIFEYGNRVNYIFVCDTEKTNEDWRANHVEETETHLIITI